MSKIRPSVLLLALFIHLVGTTSDSVQLAKRRLIKKEHELFKTNPMSQILKDFIEKTREERQLGRIKREDNEKQLYVIENNRLVPVKKIEKRFDMSNEKLEDSVVLNKNEDTSKVSEDFAEKTTGFAVSSLNPETSFNPESINALLENIGQTTNDTKSLPRLDLPKKVPTKAPSRVFIPPVVSPTSNLVTNPSIAILEVKNQDYSEESPQKTEEENKVLHKILSDVESLMAAKGGDDGKHEGALCKLEGTWISDAGGVRLEVCFKNNATKKFRVEVLPKEPPTEEGFLCAGNWTIVGELPFCHAGVMVVLALHRADKHIATFIGECRVCEGTESVTGTWMLGRSSRDCKDQKSSHQVLSDVWRRDKVETLQKEHLKKIQDTFKTQTNSTK